MSLRLLRFSSAALSSEERLENLVLRLKLSLLMSWRHLLMKKSKEGNWPSGGVLYDRMAVADSKNLWAYWKSENITKFQPGDWFKCCKCIWCLLRNSTPLRILFELCCGWMFFRLGIYTNQHSVWNTVSCKMKVMISTEWRCGVRHLQNVFPANFELFGIDGKVLWSQGLQE